MDGRHERGRNSVLLVTNDEYLQQEIRRFGAGVAVPVEVVAQADDALASWQRASAVLVGGDCAGPLARLRPGRRRAVAVVSTGTLAPDIYRHAQDLGAAQVLELPSADDWLASVLADSVLVKDPLGPVVGVLSACGGAGGTSLAAAIACRSVQRDGIAPVLIDVDPVGVGIERVLGREDATITSWRTLSGRGLSPRALRDTLPVQRGVYLVGFGGAAPAVIDPADVVAVVSACRRAFELTVLDVPRSIGTGTSGVLDLCDLVVLMCPQSVAAAMAGQRLAAVVQHPRLALLTRVGPRMVEAEHIAELLGIPLLAQVADQRGLDEALAVGADPLRSRGSGLRRAADAVLDRLREAG